MKRNRFSLFTLCVVMLLCSLAFTAFAARGEYTSGVLEYNILDDGTIQIAGYNGTAENYTIPSKIDGKKVTEIDAGAFQCISELKTLTIPGSVREVGVSSIYSCSNLETVTVEEGALASLGGLNFSHCRSLKTFNLPKNIKSLPASSGCDSLTEINIAEDNPYLCVVDGIVYSKDGKTLVKYPSGKKTERFAVPSTVKKIANNAFYGVKAIDSIFVPSSVTEIEEQAFAYTMFPIYTDAATAPSSWTKGIASRTVRYNYPLNTYLTAKELETKPLAPKNLYVLESSDGVIIKWDKVDDADGYIIYGYTSGQWQELEKITSPETVSYSFGDLMANVPTEYKIHSYKRVNGEYLLSDTGAAANLGSKPATPTKITTSQTLSSIKLGWNKVDKADGYAVYQYVNKAWKKVATVKAGSSLTYKADKLKSGTVYKFRIKAYNNDGGIIWGRATPTITIATKPETPKNPSASTTASSVTLKWSKVTGASGYVVFQYVSGKWTRAKTITSPSTVSCTVKKLKPATTYKFRIKSYKKADGKTIWGEATATIKATTKPETPKNLSATQTDSSITLKWGKVAGVSGYEVYQYVSGKWKKVKTIGSASTVSCTIKSLKPATAYKFRIKAYKKVDGKVVRGDATKTVTAVTKPARVTPVVKSNAPGQISLSWKAVTGAKNYRVYYKLGNGKYKLYKTYTTPQSLTFKNLTGGDKYTFAIRAVAVVSGQTLMSDILEKSVTVTYRTTRYLEATKTGPYYTRYTVNGQVFEEAFKGNKLYAMSYDENGEQFRMIYDGSKQCWYMIYDQYEMYVVVKDSELPVEARGSEAIKNMKNQKILTPYKSTKQEVDGKTVFNEWVKCDDGEVNYIGYIYDGVTLKSAVLDMANGLVVEQDYEIFTNKVPDSLFVVPSGYRNVS